MGHVGPRPPRNDFLRIAGVSMALALGFMAGSMQAFTRDAQGLQFRISVLTVLAFVVGALVGWWYWQIVKQMIAPAGPGAKPTGRFVLFSVLLFLAAVGSYFYRLRFVPRENVRDVAEGLVLAFLVLGVVAVAMWRVVRFLEAQDKEPPGHQ
jgi:hypothetical protein